MTTITLMDNKTGQVFDRQFEDCENARKFLIKLRYSKKLTKIAVSTETQGEYDYLLYRF